jgi:neutral ceramidase
VKKIMKRLGIGVGIFILLILLMFFLGTSSVKRRSYFNEEYFKSTSAQVDSIRAKTSIRKDSLRAGFSKVSITPVLNSPEDDWKEGKFTKVPLAGYGGRKGKPATGVHDSIFVKAVALELNKQVYILVSADLLIIPADITDSVISALADQGIRREQLYMSATHSHSSLGGWGPGFVGKQFAGDENKNLEKWLVNQICKAVTLAANDLKPARIGSGSFDAGSQTRNRFIGESGTKNNDFCFMVIEQEGYRKAIIGSFSAHATMMGDDNMEISADYPGYWERRIEGTSADLALFFAGSTGSQSARGEGEGFKKPENIGVALADTLNRYLKTVKLNSQPVFSAVSLKMHLPEYHIRLTTKINLTTFVSCKLASPPLNVYLQAMRIDNTVWITTPSDFSGEYALQVKNSLAVNGFISNVSSFNGSYVGYIIPGKYFYVDEYESRLMGWYGPEMGEYTVDMIRQITRIVTGCNNI